MCSVHANRCCPPRSHLSYWPQVLSTASSPQVLQALVSSPQAIGLKSTPSQRFSGPSHLFTLQSLAQRSLWGRRHGVGARQRREHAEEALEAVLAAHSIRPPLYCKRIQLHQKTCCEVACFPGPGHWTRSVRPSLLFNNSYWPLSRHSFGIIVLSRRIISPPPP